MNHSLYISLIDAEPIQQYHNGGYHPLSLGDTLKDVKYKVLHKLGWEATVLHSVGCERPKVGANLLLIS
jgi:hypothetical protein